MSARVGREAGMTLIDGQLAGGPGSRGPKGQHSAPRGGPPRSWTNDDLTKALENVWNKRMTTSQASRVFAIPYNSLLMYVRGKYGKSLKLDLLKAQTPAATDNLNTIGNSRSTPKEKAHFEGKKQKQAGPPLIGAPMLPSPGGLQFPPTSTPPAVAIQPMPPHSTQPVSLPPHPTGPLGLNPFAAFQNLPHLQDQMGLLGHDASRIRDLMLNLQREQHPMLAAAAAAAAASQNRSPASTPTRPGGGGDRDESATPDGTPEKVSSSVAAVAQLAAAMQQHQQQMQRGQQEERAENNDGDEDENDDVFDDDLRDDDARNADVAPEVAPEVREVAEKAAEEKASSENAGMMTGSSGEEEQMEEDDDVEDANPSADNAASNSAFQGLPEISA